jgi:Asp-tRNA(Asn)/Glu-tRNA(Gln) amidotransferase B subunit
MYHMEPNNLIYIYNTKTGIDGNYQITQFNLPLTYNGTMSITAMKAVTNIN